MVHRSNYIQLLLIAVLAAVAILLPAISRSLLPVDDPLLRGLSEARIGGGKFFSAPASDFDVARYGRTRTQAEVFLLSAPDSTANKRLRALMDAGDGRLPQAAATLQQLNDEHPESAEILNDLGVVYLGLGGENATNYFRAANLFERAARAAPRSPVPHFNAAVAFHKAQLPELADRALSAQRRLESPSFWTRAVPAPSVPVNSSLVERLRQAVETSDLQTAEDLVDRFAVQYRKIAMDYALYPPEADDLGKAMMFALSRLGSKGSDQTLSAILASLQSADRDRVRRARRLVQEGVGFYLKGRPTDSLQLYQRAALEIRGADLPFDHLWIKLKSADSQLRLLGADPQGRLHANAARDLIEETINGARTHNFEWLLGMALVSKSQSLAGVVDYDRSVSVLREAVDKLSVAGSPEDLVRPLNYLATAYAIAGDYERGLDTAYRALQSTRPDDNLRLAQLYWLAGLQLYRTGYSSYAKSLMQQAVAKAKASGNDGVIASITPYLAIYDVRAGDYASAEHHLEQMRMLRNRMVGGQETVDLALNLLCSQLMIAKGDLRSAESCLQKNLGILNRQVRPAPEYFAETLLQLAGVYSVQRRIDDARQQLRHAMEVIERNDASLATTALRMPFENQRRNIYDLAIGFEYDHEAKEVAWMHAQRYRSKLFLEFLRQMNSNVTDILGQANDREQVQRLIPADVQVLEYVMLKDRLLIWVVSRDKFFSVAVPVSRDGLDAKVSAFLRQVKGKADIRQQSAELYKLLIQPVESQLDPNRTLAIVPDLALHRLNFAALSSTETKTFLIQQYNIVGSPNLTTLLSGRAGQPTRTMAVAFGARTDNIGATRELRAVEKLYANIEMFNGQTALKPAFLSSLAQASVFHYAGHSQDAADPLRSSVLLDGEREGPNSVTALEISKRKMPANSVVVLASCDSSVGNSRDGIGMRGLTSAFLIGGAGSVVGSLWLVDSESTSRLVLEFHRNFAGNHQPVATALRNAQLAFIAEGTHPYYWSGFVVTGNTSALR